MNGELKIKNFIERIILFSKFVDTDTEIESKLTKEIECTYSVIKETELDLFQCFDIVMAGNVELYIYILSLLYHILGDNIFLDQARYLLMHNDIEYFSAEMISCHLQNEYIGKHFNITYCEERKLRKNVLGRLKHLINNDINIAYLPYKERNHKNIVLMTDQFLGSRHAPTKMVLQTYFQLIEMGYEVMLIVAVGCATQEDYKINWYASCEASFLPELDGNFTASYYGKIIQGYQFRYNRNSLSTIKRVVKKIQRWKPECVWYIGGRASSFPDIFADITTLVMLPCVRGYLPSEAQILVSITLDNSEEVMKIKEYIKEQKQKMIDISFAVANEDGRQRGEITVDFPKDRFFIALVGNRLESEIDSRFKKIMRNIIDRNPQCHYLIIGKYDKEFEEDLKEHVTKCGYQEDLLAYLERADIFLNPIRYGGGWSAVMALSVGTPVITLSGCDVAANCGEDFICKTESEIPELVDRYINDEDFRVNQERKSRKRYQDNFNINMKMEFEKILTAVKELGMEELK